MPGTSSLIVVSLLPKSILWNGRVVCAAEKFHRYCRPTQFLDQYELPREAMQAYCWPTCVDSWSTACKTRVETESRTNRRHSPRASHLPIAGEIGARLCGATPRGSVYRRKQEVPLHPHLAPDRHSGHERAKRAKRAKKAQTSDVLPVW